MKKNMKEMFPYEANRHRKIWDMQRREESKTSKLIVGCTILLLFGFVYGLFGGFKTLGVIIDQALSHPAGPLIVIAGLSFVLILGFVGRRKGYW